MSDLTSCDYIRRDMYIYMFMYMFTDNYAYAELGTKSLFMALVNPSPALAGPGSSRYGGPQSEVILGNVNNEHTPNLSVL